MLTVIIFIIFIKLMLKTLSARLIKINGVKTISRPPTDNILIH